MTVPDIDGGDALRFLSLLGKTAETTRLRAFPHSANPNRATIGARKGPYDLATASRWQREQRGIYAVINEGGDTDNQITSCLAFWIEWDHRPVHWQLTAWQEFGLGKPSLIVTTGGKSAHLYWILRAPITPEEWAPIQSALIEATGADSTNRNPSRVMRLPGAYYIGPDGSATGQTKIHSTSDNQYTADDVAAWLTAVPQTEPPQPSQHGIPLPDNRGQLPLGDLPPRPPEALREALASLPPFQHGAGQYSLLLGLALRLHAEIGPTEAQSLLAETCCQSITDLSSYFGEPPHKIHSGSIWPYLRDNFGIDISRHDLRGKSNGGATQGQQAPPSNGSSKATAQQNTGQAASPAVLTIADVRERLTYAVTNGASRPDLEALRIELAGAADLSPAALRDLLHAIQREHEAACLVEQESEAIRRAADRKEISEVLTLEYLLPPSLAHALRYRTQWLPTDDIATACTFLIGISGLIKLGSEVVASEAADYRVPLNLYGALVARSGAKKSPISRILVSAPTHDIRLSLAQEHQRALDNWQEQNRGVRPSERPDPPRPSYCSISDATAEALAAQLQIQEQRGLGLLIHRDELAGLIGGLNQYRGGRGSDSEQLLEAYDGGGFRSLRVAATGGGRFYSRCHLSIYGTIQPAILKALVADGDASGLWARFLFVPLPERVVRLPNQETDEQAAASITAAKLLSDVSSYVWALPRKSLSLTADGREAFFGYEARCQADALGASLAAQGALYAKAPGKVLRLAGVLNILGSSVSDGRASQAIDAESINRAAAVVDHLSAWTLGLHEAAAAGEASDLMRQIHRIAQGLSRPVTWRDVSQRLSKAARGSVDSGTAGAAVEALTGLGAGQLERNSRGGWRYKATADLP